MPATRGVNTLLVVRYVVFGLFIICNAITCSVAVWNHSLLVVGTQPAQLDIYLIVLGAFSLLSIFALVFVEMFCADATCVWFECAWVTLFWLMELAGGAALIAIEFDNITCSNQTTTLCSSRRVLLAFTWMCAVILLVYLLTVVLIAASLCVEDPKIWVSSIRVLRVAAIRHSSPSIPNSPMATQFRKRPSVEKYNLCPAGSQPVHAVPHPTGFSPNYKIEPLRPLTAAPEQMDIPHSSDLPEAAPLPPATVLSSHAVPVPTLPKGRNIRSSSLSQLDRPQDHVSSIVYTNPGRPTGSGPVPGQSISLPTPSPLGDWPRQDVMQLPAKFKRKPPPPRAFEFPGQYLTTITPADGASLLAETLTQPRPRHPSGPRQGLPFEDNAQRPVHLDLYGIRV